MADSYGEERGRSTGLQEPAQSDRSVAELMKQLSDQTATLVRQELDLAKAELAEKGKKAGLGAGMFGGASVFGMYALGALTACAILALALAVKGWLAALIVAAVARCHRRGAGSHGHAECQAGGASDAGADHRERQAGRGMDEAQRAGG